MRSPAWYRVGTVAFGVLMGANVGCGGGPCGDYCSAARDCYESDAPEGCDIDAASDACEDACESGLDAVPSSSRDAMGECLTCISGRLAETCELDEDVLSDCIDPCLEAGEAAFEVFGETFSDALDDSGASCGDGSTSCTFEQSGDGTTESCSISCDSGLGASCAGESGGIVNCTCSGSGGSFSTTCAQLDDGVLAEVCN